jgi:hypothetical protein
MRPTSLLRSLITLVPGLLLVLAVMPGAMARLVPIPSQGMSMEIPDDWQLYRQNGGDGFIAGSTGNSVGLSFGVEPNKEQKRIDQSAFLDTMSKIRVGKAKKDHGSILNLEAGTVLLNGVPAEFLHSEEPMPAGRTLYTRDYLIAANGKFYSLSLYSNDPFVDQKMGQIAGTLRFNHRPILPDIERPYYHRRDQILISISVLAVLAAAAATLYFKFLKSQPYPTR